MSVLFTRRGAAPSLGKLASDYEVGESVFLPVNGVNTEFLVVHQGNPDSNIYDTSCDGTWLLMKDCYENRMWHSSNVNDYANSTINAYLNSTFFGLLGISAQAAVKQVKIPYRPGSGTSKTCNTGANGLSVKAFLLSGAEVGFTSSDASYLPTNEGAKLSYFESGTGTSANNKRKANYNGTAYPWWLRSPNCDGSDYAYGVVSGGAAVDRSCSTSYGVRPAFILDSTTKFDPDTNVIL